MSDQHERQPVWYTCPDIDGVCILLDEVQDLLKKSKCEHASKAAEWLKSIPDTMKVLMQSNQALRAWAVNEANRVDAMSEVFQREISINKRLLGISDLPSNNED